jgi:hypothetical protein
MSTLKQLRWGVSDLRIRDSLFARRSLGTPNFLELTCAAVRAQFLSYKQRQKSLPVGLGEFLGCQLERCALDS